MQERHNSIANALELRLSCCNPSKYIFDFEMPYLPGANQFSKINPIKWHAVTYL